jgi:acyl-CoA dehydrogenase
MQRFFFESEHELFRDSVRRFMQNEIAPHAEKWREQGCVDRSAYTKAGEQGYIATWADEKYGGAGIDDFRYEQIIIEENIINGDIGFYINLHADLVAPYIAKLGTDEQKDRLMPGIVSGEKILAVAMTEPGAGSDLAGMKSKAVDKGDHWELSGSKTYISNGLLADVVVVAARTNPDNKYGIGLFLVEAEMEGFERGKRLSKMGLSSQDTAELFFDGVKVPRENLLGEPEEGFKYLTQFLAQERLVAAIGSMAACQAAFDLTLEYITERRAFGKPIGAFQNSRFKMAEMRTQIDSAQAFIDQCVMMLNDGTLTAEVASETKLLATELEGRVMDECVQLHGGAGYMNEYRICQMYKDARVTRIFAGTSEIMKEIIGRGLGLDERKMK